MKVPDYRRLTRTDVGKDVPAWADKILDVMNGQLEDLTRAVNGGLTLGENMRAQVIRVALKSGTEQGLKVKRVPSVVFAGSISGGTLTGFAWRIIDQEKIAVTATFTGATSASARIVMME